MFRILTVPLAITMLMLQVPLGSGAETPVKKPEKKIVNELAAYEILFEIHFEDSPLFTSNFQSNLKMELRAFLQKTYGPSWVSRFTKTPVLRNGTLNGLNRLTANQLIKSDNNLPNKENKVFFLIISSSGASYSVHGREWDIATRELSDIRSYTCYQRSELAVSTAKLVNDLFEPLFIIDRVDSNGVFLRAFAGELVPQNYTLNGSNKPDEARSFLAPHHINNGSILVAYYRYLNKDKSVRIIQPVTWTYLTVTDIKRASVEAAIISAFRSPISTRRLRRVELIAKLKRPLLPESQLTLYPTRNRTLPFAGLKVRLERKLYKRDELKTEPVFLWTNREGLLTINKGPDKSSPVTWLYVLSGESLVARVPFVPGIKSHDDIEIPDDTIRLSVEGELALLESDLITSVTKRTILFGRIKKLLLENKWDRIEKLFLELNELQGPKAYLSQLSAIRVNATEKAKAKKDRKSVSRIKKLCQNMENLVNRYIDPNKIREFQTEIRSLKDLNEKDLKEWIDEQKKIEEKQKKKK